MTAVVYALVIFEIRFHFMPWPYWTITLLFVFLHRDGMSGGHYQVQLFSIEMGSWQPVCSAICWGWVLLLFFWAGLEPLFARSLPPK
jgi:hypothetical protein